MVKEAEGREGEKRIDPRGGQTTARDTVRCQDEEVETKTSQVWGAGCIGEDGARN